MPVPQLGRCSVGHCVVGAHSLVSGQKRPHPGLEVQQAVNAYEPPSRYGCSQCQAMAHGQANSVGGLSMRCCVQMLNIHDSTLNLPQNRNCTLRGQVAGPTQQILLSVCFCSCESFHSKRGNTEAEFQTLFQDNLCSYLCFLMS